MCLEWRSRFMPEFFLDIKIFLLFCLQSGEKDVAALPSVSGDLGWLYWRVQDVLTEVSRKVGVTGMEILMMSSTGALTAAQHLRQLKYHR